jgi:dihydroorotase
MAKDRKTGVAGVATLAGGYDLVLKGGRLVDPGNGIDGRMDIAIRKGRIAAVAPDLDPGAGKTIDIAGLIVTPGLIDTHAHVYEHVSGDFGLNPDLVGVRSGVTTVVDQGARAR